MRKETESRDPESPAIPEVSAGSPSEDDLREVISRRAYARYCERGCTHGSDVDDWLEAEAEVRSELARRQADRAGEAVPAAEQGPKAKAAGQG